MDLSALAEPEPGRAVSGLTEANVALTRCGLLGPSGNLRKSSVPCVLSRDAAPGSAVTLHRWQDVSTSSHVWNKVPSRSMACMMTARRRARATRAFFRPRRFAIFIAQVFRAKVLPAASEDRVGRFVEQLAHHAVTPLGDPARPVDLTRLMTPGHKAEAGADIFPARRHGTSRHHSPGLRASIAFWANCRAKRPRPCNR